MRELERDLVPPPDATIAIVGRGRVGSSLARVADRAGLDVILAGREDALEACARADVALLCVPDEAIAEACEALGDHTPALVGHVSGASGLAPLEPAARRGSAVFSLHPLQTFADAKTEVAGMPCAISASTEAAERFGKALAASLAMRPFGVPEESRAAYHAAASIASNLLIALEESAAELLTRAGVEDARELLAPLVLQTAANWAERGPRALTGPVARGDEGTVERHREAVAELSPELLEVYDALVERTRALAGNPGRGRVTA
jgi:predicted short-subunit dehydrogenase-like oxidoreductase (DUF2520 family)